MKKEQTKNSFIKEVIIILLVGLLINLACFLMPLTVKAAGEVSTSLPLPIGIPTGLDIPDNKVEYVKNAYINYLSSNYSHDVSNSYTIFVDSIIDQGTPNETIYIVATSGFSVDLANWNTSIGYSNIQQHYCQFTYYPASDTLLGPTFYGGWVNSWTYTPADLSNYKGWVLLHYTDNIYSGSDLVWTTSFSPVLPSDTEFVEAPIIDNITAPTQPTIPTIELPTIDTSQSLIDNIKSLFQWLGNIFTNLVRWIISSIVNLFTNLLTNIKAFINALITAVNNGFKNIYNNFKSLFSVFFQSLLNFIDLIKQSQEDFFTFVQNRLTDINTIINGLGQDLATILSFYDYPLYFIDEYGFFYNQDRVTRVINNSDFILALTTFRTQASTLTNNFSNISEPDHLSFTLDFSNSFYNFGVCELSFDWILPFRNPIRLFIIGVTVLTMLTNFMEDFPAMFSGGGGHSKNTGK